MVSRRASVMKFESGSKCGVAIDTSARGLRRSNKRPIACGDIVGEARQGFSPAPSAPNIARKAGTPFGRAMTIVSPYCAPAVAKRRAMRVAIWSRVRAEKWSVWPSKPRSVNSLSCGCETIAALIRSRKVSPCQSAGWASEGWVTVEPKAFQAQSRTAKSAQAFGCVRCGQSIVQAHKKAG